MELSLSGFLFEDEYRSQSLDFSAFCALACECGYSGVELRRTQVSLDTGTRQRREVREVAAGFGLRITCLTARGLPDGGVARDECFRAQLALCQDTGCHLLKIGGDAEWLRQAASRAEDVGVVLASNNHVGGPLESVAGTLAHLRAVDHANYGLLFDCFHLTLTGEDYLDAMVDLVPFIRNVLVQSLRPAFEDEECVWERDGKRWTRALIGEPGTQCWSEVIAALKRAGYDGLITVIENGWPEPHRVHVARQCAIELRSLWEEM